MTSLHIASYRVNSCILTIASYISLLDNHLQCGNHTLEDMYGYIASILTVLHALDMQDLDAWVAI